MALNLAQRRQKERDEAIAKFDITLKNQNRRTVKHKKKTYTADNLMCDTIEKYSTSFVRSPNTWVAKIVSDNEQKHKQSLIRHLFQVYRVPKFLERVWFDRMDKQDKEYFINWYIAVATGKSLYKLHSKDALTKKGTYWFLKAPDEFSIRQNIWWSIARAEGFNLGDAGRIVRTKLAQRSYNNQFWISVMRFFLRNPLPINETNDILDCLAAKYAENNNFTMNGRTIATVKELSKVWHKTTREMKDYKHLSWTGLELKDWEYMVAGKGEHATLYKVSQILTSKKLVQEGNDMKHCVGSYASKCRDGNTSIWSLTAQHAKKIDLGNGQIETMVVGEEKKCLTIAVYNSNMTIVQARGIVNRLPKNEEKNIINQWARSSGLFINNF